MEINACAPRGQHLLSCSISRLLQISKEWQRGCFLWRRLQKLGFPNSAKDTLEKKCLLHEAVEFNPAANRWPPALPLSPQGLQWLLLGLQHLFVAYSGSEWSEVVLRGLKWLEMVWSSSERPGSVMCGLDRLSEALGVREWGEETYCSAFRTKRRCRLIVSLIEHHLKCDLCCPKTFEWRLIQMLEIQMWTDFNEKSHQEFLKFNFCSFRPQILGFQTLKYEAKSFSQ